MDEALDFSTVPFLAGWGYLILPTFYRVVPYYTIDSRTSPPNGRVSFPVHKPLHTYNGKCDSFCTLTCSTLLPCPTPFFSHGQPVSLMYRYNYIACSL